MGLFGKVEVLFEHRGNGLRQSFLTQGYIAQYHKLELRFHIPCFIKSDIPVFLEPCLGF